MWSVNVEKIKKQKSASGRLCPRPFYFRGAGPTPRGADSDISNLRPSFEEEFKNNSWLPLAVFILCLITMLFIIASCEPAFAGQLYASWYSEQSLKQEGTWKISHGIMANGQRFDENALTCACRLYPLGSILRITNIKNGKNVTVKVTDRIGARFAKTRIDLSLAAFKSIGDLKHGLLPITVEVVR